MNRKVPEKYEVAIVGQGPAGCTLANVLGQYGLSTIILDREASAYHLPRAVAFDDEVMRVFQSLDLDDQVNAISEVGGDAHFVDENDELLVTWSRPQRLSPNNWYYNYRFHQPELEDVLREGFLRFGCVTARWGCEVTRYETGTDEVIVHYLDKDRNESRQLRASYVVGCDGARSFTRQSMDSDYEDLDFAEDWLVVDLLAKIPEDDADPGTYHFCDPARSGSRVFVGRSRKRWELRLNPGDDPLEITKPDNIWKLLERWTNPDQATLERAAIYTFRSAIAEKWHSGRLFIAGDAAHLTPPFMGQGMCAGVRDAANLGWKLARVVNGDASASILDSYESERKPHVRAFIEMTVKMGRLINRTASTLLTGAPVEDDNGPPTITRIMPTLGDGLSAGNPNWRGHLFPQPRLANSDLLDDRLGNRPALIVSPGFMSDLPANVREKAEARNVAIIHEACEELTAWFTQAQTGAVLLRPDRYILGSADTQEELEALIEAA